MDKKIKVSVIVPCYQVEQFIEQSVKSIKEQNFEGFEIILVNDGTKDKSIEKAIDVLNGFENCSIIHKENGGLPSARNYGLREAKGKYVCFIDSDDIISPNHISSLYFLCETYKLLASFSLFEVTAESNRHGTPCTKVDPHIISRNDLLNGFMKRSLKIHCCSLLINREYLLKESLIFNEVLRFAEDVEFMWRLFPKLEKIGCTGASSYKYLYRKNSLMTSQSVDRVKIAIEELNKTITDNNLSYPKDKKIWSILPPRTYIGFCRSFAKSASYTMFSELIEKTNRFNMMKMIICYPGIKIKCLALLFIISKKAFYHISSVYS